jgi:hypothetical protein
MEKNANANLRDLLGSIVLEEKHTENYCCPA